MDPDFDGLIVFDESHKGKNHKGEKPTQMGAKIVELQERLPKARIVYCSATGASEPINMSYMDRLGLWGAGTPFPLGFEQFQVAVERGKLGMMELVSMHLRKEGTYICRTLSFSGCKVKPILRILYLLILMIPPLFVCGCQFFIGQDSVEPRVLAIYDLVAKVPEINFNTKHYVSV